MLVLNSEFNWLSLQDKRDQTVGKRRDESILFPRGICVEGNVTNSEKNNQYIIYLLSDSVTGTFVDKMRNLKGQSNNRNIMPPT